jgi:hypothetical protein
MSKLPLSEVADKARKIFGDKLICLFAGGSEVYGDNEAKDLDLVVIVESYRYPQAKKFIKHTGASIRVITRMMFNTQYYDGKVATMLYKPMEVICGELPDQPDEGISFRELQDLHNPLMKQNLSEIWRKLNDGKLSPKKAIDLISQLLVIANA